MQGDEIIKKIEEFCRDVFDDNGLTVTKDTTADDVAGWDSLTYLSLVSELEEFYGIHFLLDEVDSNKSIGELADHVERHLKEHSL